MPLSLGECPEWQRELTVNQPPHGFEGSSPSFPTSFRPRLRAAQPSEDSRNYVSFQIRLRDLAAGFARVLQEPFAPLNRGRRESRVLAAPAASRAKLDKAHERSHHRFRRIQPGLPRAMVLTAYFVLSPATNSSCHRHPRIKGLYKARSGRLASANLTPATGARTTRLCRPR